MTCSSREICFRVLGKSLKMFLIRVWSGVSYLRGVLPVIENAVEIDPLELDVAQQWPH